MVGGDWPAGQATGHKLYSNNKTLTTHHSPLASSRRTAPPPKLNTGSRIPDPGSRIRPSYFAKNILEGWVLQNSKGNFELPAQTVTASC